MNIKLITRALELTDDDWDLAVKLRALSETERELFRQALGPAAKVVKKPATQPRKIEHCAACDYTKRAAVHKDTSASDYHEFQSSKPKSARASGMATAIKDSLKRGQAADNTNDGERCTHQHASGRQCWLLSDHNVHHLESAIGYHEFVAGKLDASSAEPPSTPASSETGAGVAGDAHHVASGGD